MKLRYFNWKMFFLSPLFLTSCQPDHVFYSEQLSHVKSTDVLNDSFNMHAYNSCTLKILSCPLESETILREVSCIDEIPECSQILSIGEVVGSPIELLTLKEFSSYLIVQKKIQNNKVTELYILNPAGKLTNTNVDPRTVDLKLLKKYKDVDALLQVLDNITYKSTRTNDIFTVPFRMTKGFCLDCNYFAHGDLEFIYNKTNFELDKVQVKDFHKG